MNECFIEKRGEHYTALVNGKVISHCPNVPASLQSIWSNLGLGKDKYCHLNEDGSVYITDREVEDES